LFSFLVTCWITPIACMENEEWYDSNYHSYQSDANPWHNAQLDTNENYHETYSYKSLLSEAHSLQHAVFNMKLKKTIETAISTKKIRE